MNNHLIEVPYPLKTTDLRNGGRRRLVTPRPGDVVDFILLLGQYPAAKRYGTIESVAKDRIHFCCEHGSIFICDNGETSISGGPFCSVPATSLVAAHDLAALPFSFPIMRQQSMWNWGTNGSGAGNGVHYSVTRPVFLATCFGKAWKEVIPTYSELSGITLTEWRMIATAVQSHLNPA